MLVVPSSWTSLSIKQDAAHVPPPNEASIETSERLGRFGRQASGYWRWKRLEERLNETMIPEILETSSFVSASRTAWCADQPKSSYAPYKARVLL